MVHSAENRFRDDAMTITNLMPLDTGARRSRGGSGMPWPKAGVRATVICSGRPTLEAHAARGAHSTESRNPDILGGSSRSGVRRTRSPAAPHRRLEDRQFHRRDRPIDTPGVNAVVVVDDVSMRLIARHHHPELLDRPFRRRMVGHVPVQDPARAPSDGGMRR